MLTPANCPKSALSHSALGRIRGTVLQVKVTDVFRSLGQPTITYVRRDAGKYERLLSGGLDVRGQLCLLTGPSKTGKTTLYKRVLEEKKLLPLTVRCDGDLTHEQFWRRALEGLGFERVKEYNSTQGSNLTTSGKLSGNIGWKWLAGLAGEFSLEWGRPGQRVRFAKRSSQIHRPPIWFQFLKLFHFCSWLRIFTICHRRYNELFSSNGRPSLMRKSRL